MDASEIRRIVELELEKGATFVNFHGLTAKNVRNFLVEPRLVEVEVDLGESTVETTPMWIVLTERPPDGGYFVVFDPASAEWGIAERTGTGYILVVGADSFAGALEGM